MTKPAQKLYFKRDWLRTATDSGGFHGDLHCTLKEIGLEPQLLKFRIDKNSDCTLKEIGLEPQQVSMFWQDADNCTLKEIGLEPQPKTSTTA